AHQAATFDHSPAGSGSADLRAGVAGCPACEKCPEFPAATCGTYATMHPTPTSCGRTTRICRPSSNQITSTRGFLGCMGSNSFFASGEVKSIYPPKKQRPDDGLKSR